MRVRGRSEGRASRRARQATAAGNHAGAADCPNVHRWRAEGRLAVETSVRLVARLRGGKMSKRRGGFGARNECCGSGNAGAAAAAQVAACRHGGGKNEPVPAAAAEGWGRCVGVWEMFMGGERRGRHEQANGAKWGQGQWDRLLQRKQEQKKGDGWEAGHTAGAAGMSGKPAGGRRPAAAAPAPQWQGAGLRRGPCQASIRRHY